MNTTVPLGEVKRVLLRERSEASYEAIVPGVFLGAAVVPVVIGCLHVLAEVSPKAKSFLTLHAGIGPYSGKVLFGYLAGLLAALLWPLVGRRVGHSARAWLAVFLGGLLLGTALVFTPVVHWLAELLQ